MTNHIVMPRHGLVEERSLSGTVASDKGSSLRTKHFFSSSVSLLGPCIRHGVHNLPSNVVFKLWK